MRRVVVTGLGVATSLGLSVEENWESLLSGVSGIRLLDFPEAEGSAVKAAGALRDNDWQRIRAAFPEDAAQEGERRTLFSLWAAGAALKDAGVSCSEGGRDRYGVSFAAGLGVNCLEDIHRWKGNDGKFDIVRFGQEYRQVHPASLMRNNASRAAALIAKRSGFQGMNCTVTTACASGTQAIGAGFRAVQRGDADLMIAGGADSMLNPVGLIFFVLLGAASISADDPLTACRPFDRKRSGLVMGEGAGFAVLEEEGHALRRGAKIYAEVSGYASSMDAYQVTAPHPRGIGAEQAMRSALKDAGMEPEDIDYINAHGTSTKLNDAGETMAIKNVFRAHADNLAISSSKSMIGHLLAASGGPEFVYTVLSVHHDAIHPTINLTHPDPKCDLDYVAGGRREKTVRAALSNSFGFGGQNASIIVKKYLLGRGTAAAERRTEEL
ncbi:MAG: beta-ketoacyl-[acyl-carrier-protein] synthase family protein [Nitrospirae bacterium]|nr:beta-ketoacyl-[acyl-carrier-protein] synthase family protein [Nitrospirota bacterium]